MEVSSEEDDDIERALPDEEQDPVSDEEAQAEELEVAQPSVAPADPIPASSNAPKPKKFDPILAPISVPKDMKNHLKTNQELNSKTKSLSNILKRDYTSQHLDQKIQSFDSYAQKLDNFVQK